MSALEIELWIHWDGVYVSRKTDIEITHRVNVTQCVIFYARYLASLLELRNRMLKGIRACKVQDKNSVPVYKKNMEYKLTPTMRAEVKKMDEYSNEIRLLTKYDITNSDELNKCKTNLNGQLSDFIRQRNNLYYKRQNMAENENKDEINKEIEMVSTAVTKIRNEIKLCNKIKVKVPVMKEELEKINIKEKQENTKKKSRDYYR